MIYKIKLLDKELVDPPIESQLFLTIKSFGHIRPKGERPRSRPTLVPPQLIRTLPTQVEVVIHKEALFYPLTPPALSEQGVEVLGVHHSPLNGELLVRVISFNHQPVYLQHGTPLVRLAFVVPLILLEEGDKK